MCNEIYNPWIYMSRRSWSWDVRLTASQSYSLCKQRNRLNMNPGCFVCFVVGNGVSFLGKCYRTSKNQLGHHLFWVKSYVFVLRRTCISTIRKMGSYVFYEFEKWAQHRRYVIITWSIFILQYYVRSSYVPLVCPDVSLLN